MAFSKLELVECAFKELQRRRDAAPRAVQLSRIKQKDADAAIKRMHAIYRILSRMDERELERIQL